MSEQLKVDGHAVEAARVGLLDAGRALSARGAGAQVLNVASLTGIGDEIEQFLRGLKVTRSALADAAREGSMALSMLLLHSEELDAALTAPLVQGERAVKADEP
ncbi:MAG: hypothetical protein ACTIJ6_11315 [Leucobacter sp.]